MVWTKCLWDEKDLTCGLLVFQSMRNPTVPPIGVYALLILALLIYGMDRMFMLS